MYISTLTEHYIAGIISKLHLSNKFTIDDVINKLNKSAIISDTYLSRSCYDIQKIRNALDILIDMGILEKSITSIKLTDGSITDESYKFK